MSRNPALDAEKIRIIERQTSAIREGGRAALRSGFGMCTLVAVACVSVRPRRRPRPYSPLSTVVVRSIGLHRSPRFRLIR